MTDWLAASEAEGFSPFILYFIVLGEETRSQEVKQLTASDTAGLGCELFKSILKSALKCSFIKCHKEQAPSLSQPQVSTGPALTIKYH